MAKRMGSSGSPRHTETVGPGPVAGAGEMPAKGPGMSRETRGTLPSDMYPSDKPGKGPGKVPNRTRGQEEDGN